MNDWFTTIDGIATRVWGRLVQAANERALIGFATVSPTGDPEARTVVLRAADRDAGVLEVYTDLQSDKITSLRAHSQASVLLWDEDLKLQIRAKCTVTIQTGADVMDRWGDIPDHSRLSYGITPPPGQVIAHSKAYTKAPDPEVFAVLSCTVTHLDAVHLGRPHRRAAFTRDPASNKGEWTANWLAP